LSTLTLTLVLWLQAASQALHLELAGLRVINDRLNQAAQQNAGHTQQLSAALMRVRRLPRAGVVPWGGGEQLVADGLPSPPPHMH
jgi:hypothetical protein